MDGINKYIWGHYNVKGIDCQTTYNKRKKNPAVCFSQETTKISWSCKLEKFVWTKYKTKEM